jgi:hypothetical protein
MKIMVGAPVYRREWIIEQWFQYMFAALEHAGVEDYSFAFVGDYRDPTFEIINEFGTEYKVYSKSAPEEDLGGRKRTWDHDLYDKMVYLRNDLLYIPRQMEPDFFLSADTDILINPEALSCMLESIQKFDAVGGKLYMTPRSKFHPSCAKLGREGQLIRSKDPKGVFEAEIIMALKLMTPDAYNVNYYFHEQGEDIGWCLQARYNGLKLGFDGRVANKHIMDPSMLDKVDDRVGY